MDTKKKIMVVDDELALRAIVTAELQEEGYDVTSAGDGDEAINLLRSEHFDLVLLDNKMQKVDGSEVLRFVRQSDPTITVVMVTGSRDLPIEVDAEIRAADEVIIKPFDLKTLLSTVDRYLQTPDQAPANGSSAERPS